MLGRHELDRNVDVELEVPGHPDRAHPAAPDRSLQPVPPGDDGALLDRDHGPRTYIKLGRAGSSRRLFLQEPKEQVNLKPGEVYVVRPKRPHLVTNGGAKSLTFLVLQGVGEDDFVPLLPG